MYQQYLIHIVVSFFCGLFSAYLAQKQQKNRYIWFIVGFGLGLLGVMAMFFFTQQKKQPSNKPVEPEMSIQGPNDKLWYYLDKNHERKGPMSLNLLTTELRQGKISLSTYVWNEELPSWKLLDEFVVKK